MKQHSCLLILCSLLLLACNNNETFAQASTKKIGGPCEGCEAIYESPKKFELLKSADSFADYHQPGPKLKISGVVYKADGKTPAEGVVLYAYHTDQKGVYPTRGDETNWGKRHGYLRAWVKTDQQGRYEFYTLRPAPYPGRKDPAHIHITIKEPSKNEYYIDEYLFADDPLLKTHPAPEFPRGGNGVLTLKTINNHLYGVRDIILGQNIPDYPREPR